MKTQAKNIKITPKTFLINELYSRETSQLIGFERVSDAKNSQAGGTSNFFNIENVKVGAYELPDFYQKRVYFRGEWL